MRPLCRRRAFVVLLGLALLGTGHPVFAQWESGWDTCFALPLRGADATAVPFAGFTARAGLVGLTALEVNLGLGAGLRVVSGGEAAPSAMPWAGLSLGRDIRLGGWIVVSPLLGAEIRVPLGTSPVRPGLGFTGGASVGVHLGGQTYVLLSGEAAVSATGSTPAFLSLSLGIRQRLYAPRGSGRVEVPPSAADGGRVPAVGRSATASASASAPAEAPELRLSWTVSPTLFSPDDDGRDDTLVAEIRAEATDPVASWRLQVLESSGRLFYSVGGDGPPPARLEWDGRSGEGTTVESAREYELLLTVTDRLGREATRTGKVLIDILVVRDGDRYRIRLPTIEFLPDSDAVDPLTGAEILEQNRVVLTKLAEILRRFPGYSIVVEGHANSVYWQDPERASIEQRDELIPLSLRRAQSVREALLSLGIEAGRIATVGRGGSEPLVPFSSTAESGRNRRVDVILLK